MTTTEKSVKEETPVSSASTMKFKLKLALGEDIRRISKQVTNVHQLNNVAKETFGRDLYADQIKYYYVDSDEDHVVLSDDEDFESAVKSKKKGSLKIFVENYDSKKDPFFCSSISSGQKAEANTGTSSERNLVNESKLSKL